MSVCLPRKRKFASSACRKEAERVYSPHGSPHGDTWLLRLSFPRAAPSAGAVLSHPDGDRSPQHTPPPGPFPDGFLLGFVSQSLSDVTVPGCLVNKAPNKDFGEVTGRSLPSPLGASLTVPWVRESSFRILTSWNYFHITPAMTASHSPMARHSCVCLPSCPTCSPLCVYHG